MGVKWHIYTHTHIYTYMHTYTHIYLHISPHTHIYAHTLTLKGPYLGLLLVIIHLGHSSYYISVTPNRISVTHTHTHHLGHS